MKLVNRLWVLTISVLLLVACSENSGIEEINCSALPTLTTGDVSGLGDVFVTLAGTIAAPTCGESVISQGFVYATSEFPKISDSFVEVSGAEVSKEVVHLEQNTTYYYRTYFTNVTGTYYGKQKSFTTEILEIGTETRGGIVFYIAATPTDLDGDGVLDTGLVCATTDQSSGVQWYNGRNSTTGATARGVGSGATNTATIIAAQGSGTYAASVASNYDGGGFNDWFLPSKDELNLMYTNLKVQGLGSFSNSSYWSATEYLYNYTWKQNFSGGGQNSDGKYDTNRVRAVRAF